MRTLSITAVFIVGTAAQFFGGTACAQGTAAAADGAAPTNAPEAPEGIKSYLGRTVSLTGSLRVRMEAPNGSDFTLSPADAYTLTRIRLGVGFAPLPWMRFYAESQDSRAEFYRTVPSGSLVDPFDFRQAYAEFGKREGSRFRVRAGRQEILLGSGRLITWSDWSNVGKTFDIIRGMVNTSVVKMDVIAGSVVQADPTRMDRHKPGEHVYAAYTSFGTLIPYSSIEPYVIAKTAMNVKGKDGKLGNADIIYGGMRLVGKLNGGFDYSAEVVREGGSYANDTVQSFGYELTGGRRFTSLPWKPRLNTTYLWAAGDDNRKDGHHQTFDYLYGGQQPGTSLTGQFAWRNIADWRAGVELAPWKKLSVKVDFRDYWLPTVQDGLYNCFGTRVIYNIKATSSHVGEGFETMFTANVTPKWTMGAGIGTLAPGGYLKQSGKNTGFVYPYIVITRTLTAGK